jgi:biopolymer transport protein ExbB
MKLRPPTVATRRSGHPRTLILALLMLLPLGFGLFSYPSGPLYAQAISPPPDAELEDRWEAAWGPEDEWKQSGAWDDAELAEESPATGLVRETPALNLFELFWQSRWWMLPILVMSFIVITVGVERALSLRRSRVLPWRLEKELLGLVNHQHGLEPREALRICRRYPSAAASVVQAMLLKVGRPHGELEQAVHEASDRAAQRLYSNVRWLNLASGVTPLMGLMGTVWGMIRAFHDTTQMAPGLNKAEYLAEGIYLALVTTLAGLAVAIPATILAHFFEGRVVSLFHHVDELMMTLMPHVERYEGRGRYGAMSGEAPPPVDPSRIATASGNSPPLVAPGPVGTPTAPPRTSTSRG